MPKQQFFAQEGDRSWVISWLQWHYGESPKALAKIIINFLRFNLNFFSIPLLLKTLVYQGVKGH